MSIAGVVPRIEGSHKGSLEGCRSFLFIARALIHTLPMLCGNICQIGPCRRQSLIGFDLRRRDDEIGEVSC